MADACAGFGAMSLAVQEGVNACQGVTALNDLTGTAAVACTAVTAASRIFLTVQSPGAGEGDVVGSPYVSSLTPGVGFTIASTSTVDGSTVAYEIFSAC